MTTLQYTERLTVVHCTCGIAHGIPTDLHQQLLDHRASDPGRTVSVYCPLGHEWHYTGKSEATREREAREAAERKLSATRDLLAHEERSHAATRGHLTRKQKQIERVEAGVCPHCRRNFQNLARHMHSKHPEVA